MIWESCKGQAIIKGAADACVETFAKFSRAILCVMEQNQIYNEFSKQIRLKFAKSMESDDTSYNHLISLDFHRS